MRGLPPNIDEQLISQFEGERAGLAWFEANIEERWGYPLDLLHALSIITRRAGQDWINSKGGGTLAGLSIDDLTVVRLHMRACRTTSEMVALLRAGHADGALSRWRTMHEIVVVTRLIRKHGERVAQRYHDSDAIHSFLAAQEYQKYAPNLGMERLPAAETRAIKKAYQDVQQRYGEKEFCILRERDFGWAHGFVDASPKLDVLEREVDLLVFRPFYRLANRAIHAPAAGLHFALGDPSHLFPTMPAPSNAGLEIPGQLLSIYLVYMTEALLQPAGSILAERKSWRADERVLEPWQSAYLKIMGNLADTAKDAFGEAATVLLAEQAAK